MDLAKVLWFNSISSEAWFDRRTNYTRTLAVMSMVGYILGLGDRHPCNLMIHQHSGAVIHVDFGDCFEVAMTREKFPERIPFRLTRMLVAAMELSGIEGSFRSTCENVMRVLRVNAESVMAVLEAFVYDPLLGWRLLKPAKLNTHQRVDDPAVLVEAPIVGGAATGGHGVGDIDGADTDVFGMQRTTSNDLGNDSPSIIRSATTTGAATNNAFAISQHANSSSVVHQSPEHLADVTDELNAKALSVIGRVEAKLGWREFDVASAPTDVSSQVDRLVKEAMSHVNLCQCYVGCCPFW